MDKAVLSGGSNPTGTITFTLYYGSTLVDTETAAVNANGTYTTPNGYSLPTTGIVIGIYQWDVNYSGDTNNVAASKSNAIGELVTVTAPAGAVVRGGHLEVDNGGKRQPSALPSSALVWRRLRNV
jgi:hypothetical protein